jgi:hypothetical protein
MAQNNYLTRKKQLMRTFDKLLARVEPAVIAWLGEEQANRFMQEARQEYEELIPRIPFIGNNPLLLSFFFPTSRYLAVYRALQRQGRTVEEAGRLVYLMGAEEARAIPYLARRVLEYLWFSRLFRQLLKRRATKSQRRRYPGDFVMNYVEGDEREFDYGLITSNAPTANFCKPKMRSNSRLTSAQRTDRSANWRAGG